MLYLPFTTGATYLESYPALERRLCVHVDPDLVTNPLVTETNAVNMRFHNVFPLVSRLSLYSYGPQLLCEAIVHTAYVLSSSKHGTRKRRDGGI